MEIVAGIDALNTPGLFAAAKRRIILHAAVYGAFAKSKAHRNGLKTAIRKPEFKRLDIITIDPEHGSKWTFSFLKALRFGISIQGITDEIASSHQFLTKLAAQHPDKIHLHPARRLPCLPIIVADNTIVFGQYAHAGEHAPHGFWGKINTDVEKLMEWTQTGKAPTNATNKEIASFRLINECVRAMNTTLTPRTRCTP
ncbi:hypothetical protein SYK_30830 [Pseudodesulfovibrio nedwellii]|uniref:Uncharacterized protein n=1 Tax=Pseudodesulfovibrio nedwellii TaxID=2973072 RepID=A0ABN6S8M4_9BACT|nr:hypothetical protein [Pseudodesulfovibrio nedwellii]BDQ38723.1 hypothetical protein SYK_30830 [Pseudodesulfovibrio nedwellii]